MFDQLQQMTRKQFDQSQQMTKRNVRSIATDD